jgi:hypothetical protein
VSYLPIKETVWLANSHGDSLGDTNLFVEEMICGGDGSDSISMVRTFVLAFVRRIGCSDSPITAEEAKEMIKGSYVKDDKTFIKLPERFACPNHGFAEPQ